MRRAIPLGLALVTACTAAGQPEPSPEETRPAPGPTLEAHESPPVPVEPVEVQVLWSEGLVGRGHVFARLHGVDAQRDRAWVSVSNVNQVPEHPDLFWELIEVDTETGETIERWRTSFGSANADRRKDYGLTWPLADEEADIARLIDIATHARTTSGVWGAPVVVSPNGNLGIHHRYGDDKYMGDQLIMTDRNGQNSVRLDRGFVAGYSPAFAPDGTMVAFTACKMKRGEGCQYGTYIHTLGGETQQIDGLEHANHLEWSTDGKALYLIDTADAQPFAARYILGAETHERIQGEPLRSLSLAESPSGKYLVVSGYYGEPGEQTAQHTWYEMPALVRVAEYELKLGTDIEAVRDDGVALVHGRGGLVAVDPFREREGMIPGLYQGARATTFGGQGTIILGHTRFSPQREATFELVRINPDAMLREPLHSL